MSLFQLGRVCMKVAGRDAGKRCVVIKEEGQFVLVDGETRRRKVNVIHLEPLSAVVKVAEDAKPSAVAKALEPLGIKVSETKARTVGARPRQVRKSTKKPVVEAKATKPKVAKKAAPKKAKEAKVEVKAETKAE